MVGASQKPGVVPMGLILGEAEGLEVKAVNVVQVLTYSIILALERILRRYCNDSTLMDRVGWWYYCYIGIDVERSKVLELLLRIPR